MKCNTWLAIAGKRVKTLASGDKKPGYYNLVWNRQDTKGALVPVASTSAP